MHYGLGGMIMGDGMKKFPSAVEPCVSVTIPHTNHEQSLRGGEADEAIEVLLKL